MATTEPRHRWLWFAGLYVAGVLGVAGVAYGLRWMLTLFVPGAAP